MNMLFKTLFLLSLLFLASCASESHQHLYGQEMYTKVGFHYEKGRHLTTNYQVGNYVTAGTKVIVHSVKGKTVVLAINGQIINIVNVAKFSQLTQDGVVERYLSTKPVAKIATKSIAIGMNKEQLLKSIGYPPAHVTASTALNHWVYWKNRFDRVKVIFVNDKVSEIID